MIHQLGVELGHNGPAAAGDGDHPELQLILCRDGRELRDLHVQKGRVLLQFENLDLEFATGKIHRLGG